MQSSNIYRPRTKETRQIYEKILHNMRLELGDAPPEEIEDTANEIIDLLKERDLTPQQKQEQLNAIIRLDNTKFTRLLNLTKNLKDYNYSLIQQSINEDVSQVRAKSNKEVITSIEINQLEGGEEESGMRMGAIIDEADDDGDYVKEFVVDDDEEGVKDKEVEETENQDYVRVENSGLNQMDFEGSFGARGRSGKDDLPDGDWLQEELAKIYPDPVRTKEMLEKVLKVLEISNEIQCQNELIGLLNFSNYNLIKNILDHKVRVYYLTRLGDAASQEDKEKILEAMRNDKQAQGLLRELDFGNSNNEMEVENGGAQVAGSQSNPVKINLTKDVKSLMKLAEETKREREKFSNIKNLSNKDFVKLSKSLVNLDNLKFVDGNHQMTNTRCTLPPGSHKQKFKGYEEVYIPAPTRSKENNIKLIRIDSLPEWTHECFKGIKALNPIQSRVYESAFKSAENLLVCAPTGAGKTNIALLTILQQIGMYRDRHGNIDLKKFKIVYIAPMKALVSEIVGSFSRRLDSYGIQVREMTGDMQLSRREIDQTQVIIATPEKWDIVTRKSGDKLYLDTVRLLIIDEIHLLHDSRGPVLESLVARTMRHTERTGNHVRIVGLSATLPNYVDVASFLRIDADRGMFYFDGSFRPIPLEQKYIGITDKKGMRRMLLMKEILYETVMERVGKHQTLVFVHSRKDTGKTGKDLKDQAYANDELARFFREESSSRTVLEAEAENVIDPVLKELLPFGIGIHHAGLSRDDRNLVEDLFSDKHLQVLISTATLAWGVNLPARTVIIKGTQIYNPEKGRWVELSPQDMLQMLGRAGRPNLDSKGEGIIITGHSQLKFYLSLINNQLPIESQFVSQLADQLNAEIVLGTISCLKEAVDWLGYTYLYTRMMKDPHVYGIDADDLDNDQLLIKRRSNLIHSAALLLDRHNLVRYDRRAGTFISTTLGRIASHYYIKHPSIAVYSEHIRQGMDMIELFRIFSLSSEFKYIPIRDSEKIELERLLSLVPIPVRGAQDDPRTKINVLLQAHISKMKLEGYALKSDMVYVTQSAARIMRGLFEVFLKRGWSKVAESCLNICKMIDKRQWSCMTPLRQYTSIPEKILRRIENQEHLTWEHFFNMTPQQVGTIIKYEKLSHEVHRRIHQFPRLKLNAYVQPLTRSRIKVELSITTEFEWVGKIHGSLEPFWIFVTDVDDEILLHYQFFVLTRKKYKKELIFEFTVPLLEPLHPQYFVKVTSDRWLHCETIIPISFKNLLLPSKFPPCTDLVEMKPITSSHFESEGLRKFLKARRIGALNPLQVQMCNSLLNTYDNLLIGAPGNSGKTIAALIALSSLFENDKNKVAKALFLVPFDDIIKRFERMLNQLCRHFGRKLCKLTGTTKTDLKLISEHDLIISSAEHFDNISRRWDRRPVLKKIRFVIFKHIHLITHGSSSYEVVCSRLRNKFAENDIKVRFIALGMPIANSRDISEWLGIESENVFNFHPKNRPIPLDLYIQSFDQHEATSRFYAMTRSLYQTIDQKGGEDPIIIFVDDKKSARLAASHLVSYATSSGQEKKYVKLKNTECKDLLEDSIGVMKDAYLKFFLSVGIGYIYEGMVEEYKQTVIQLFKIGIIQILIQPYSLVWGLEIKARTVVLLDIKKFNGREDRFVDYSNNEILEMLGRAGRPKVDTSSQCLLFCHSAMKSHLKKFLFDPIPVESHLHHYLAEHINAEIASKTIKSKQDCMNWISWTFFFRRLQQNPNYYNLLGISDAYKNEHLSELIENTIDELSQGECVLVKNDEMLSSINGGLISSFYYIHISTVNLFLQSIDANCSWKSLLEILSASREFDEVRIGKNEENLLKTLTYEAIYKPKKPNYCDPAVKTNLLIQSVREEKRYSRRQRACPRLKISIFLLILFHFFLFS